MNKQKEEFEGWARRYSGYAEEPHYKTRSTGEYESHFIEKLWQAWQAAQACGQQAEPVAWVIQDQNGAIRPKLTIYEELARTWIDSSPENLLSIVPLYRHPTPESQAFEHLEAAWKSAVAAVRERDEVLREIFALAHYPSHMFEEVVYEIKQLCMKVLIDSDADSPPPTTN